MPSLPYEFDVAVEGHTRSVRIDWGHDPGWVDRERELLDSAERLSLIPKGDRLDRLIYSVVLGPGRRWILNSRVVSAVNQNTGARKAGIRLYLLGWQTTFGGKNIKCKMWIYPNGMVEMCDEPSQDLIKSFLDAQPFYTDEGAGWAEEIVFSRPKGSGG